MALPDNEQKRHNRSLDKTTKTLQICTAPEGMVIVYGDEEGEYFEKVFGLALVTDGEFEHVRPIVDGGGFLDAGEFVNAIGFDIMKPGQTEAQLLASWADKNDRRKAK